jgi:exodeoxyribonuclease-3
VRIVSWNVNGLRAVDRNQKFRRFLESSEAWLVGVQEVRALPEQLPRRLTAPKGWNVCISPAEKKGYSGVAVYSRAEPDEVVTELGEADLDAEGRLIIARFGQLVVANVYFPNGSGPNRDHSRVPFKLRFYQRLYQRLQDYREAGRRVLVMGDFNTAHREIDLARPKQNKKTSGFLPIERKELDRWIEGGWIDTFRARNDQPGHYTWWSQRKGVREKNVGWRIDYVLACPQADDHVEDAFIWPRVKGSDHCPTGVELGDAVLR